MNKRFEDELIVCCSLCDLDFSRVYSYLDYVHWRHQDKGLQNKGKVFKLRPPFTFHQRVSTTVFTELYIYSREKNYRIFSSRLVGQPIDDEVCVISDLKSDKMRGCLRAPDTVIEIRSPDNPEKELASKNNLCEQFGLEECWIAHPNKRSIIKYNRNAPKVLPGFELKLEEVFM